MSAGPLDGVRILDLTQVLAGPSMTRLAAELGATVVKVEPPGGETSRRLPWLRDGRSGYFIQQNRGKRSLCVDLRLPEGRDLLARLVPSVDVVAESFRPGVLDRLGLAWERLQELNPRVILCSVSAFGQEGPLAGLPGYDTVGAALSGMAYMAGEPGRTPCMPTPAIGDAMAGLGGFGALAAALFERERTGRGRWVEVSLLDVYMHAHDLAVQMIAGSRGGHHPRRGGPVHPAVVPAGTFPVGGGHLFLACVSDKDWGRLCAAMGAPELGDDPRYASNELRVERRDEITARIAAWLDGLGDRARALRELEAAGVACAPILTVEEALALPHNVERGTVRTVTDPVWGELELPGPPFRFHGLEPDPALEAPFLGEHNADVLRELLGLDDGEIAGLAAAGVLASE